MFGFINPRRPRTPEENQRVENLPGPLRAMDSEFNPNQETRRPHDPPPGPTPGSLYTRQPVPVVRNGSTTQMHRVGNTGRWRIGNEELSHEEAVELMHSTNDLRDRLGVGTNEELSALDPQILELGARGLTREQAERRLAEQAARPQTEEEWLERYPQMRQAQPPQQQPRPVESLAENVEDVQPTAAMQASTLEDAMEGGRYREPEGTPQRIQANEPQAIVSHLQQALQSSGRDIEVDGRWGPETASVMAEVARENRLPRPRADNESVSSGEIRAFIDSVMRGR